MNHFLMTALLALLPAASVLSQNLVLNPSFEMLNGPKLNMQPCTFMKLGKTFNHFSKSWTSFPDRTPDLIRYDTTAGTCIYPPPRSGHYAVGLITFLPRQDCGQQEDYHEYVQGQLREPLVPGQRYKVSFWVSQSDRVSWSHLRSVYGDKVDVYPVAANNLGVALQVNALNTFAGLAQQREWLNLQPVFECPDVIQSDEDGAWQCVQGWFTATEAARYFLIGNFRPDVDTRIASRRDLSALPPVSVDARKTALNKAMRIAYYCIDDVAIEPAAPGDELAASLTGTGRYLFSGVFFDTGSHQLDPTSHAELDALAAWLLQHPTRRAEIAGHTDNVGQAEANRLLSQRRATAVRDYLAAKGVPAAHLTAKGYGPTLPVADNDTEEGRRRNRRVECVLQ